MCTVDQTLQSQDFVVFARAANGWRVNGRLEIVIRSKNFVPGAEFDIVDGYVVEAAGLKRTGREHVKEVEVAVASLHDLGRARRENYILWQRKDVQK